MSASSARPRASSAEVRKGSRRPWKGSHAPALLAVVRVDGGEALEGGLGCGCGRAACAARGEVGRDAEVVAAEDHLAGDLSERRAARFFAPPRASTCRATIWSRVSGVAAESETASRTAQGMSSPVHWGHPARAARGDGVPYKGVSPTRGRTSYATGRPAFQGCKLARPTEKETCMDGLMMDLPLTLLHVFDRAGRYFGKTEIVWRRPDKTVQRSTYARVPPARAEARQRAHAAGRQAGRPRGDARPGTTAATSSCTSASRRWARVLHTLNLRLSPDRISPTSSTTPRTPSLFVDASLLPLCEKFRAAGASRRARHRHADARRSRLRKARSTTSSCSRPRAADFSPARARGERTAAVICYTSGTTGKPKGVALQPPLDWCCTRWRRRCRTRWPLPARHGAAGGADVPRQRLGPALTRRRWWARSRSSPGRTWTRRACSTCCRSERVTLAAGVPTIWLGMLGRSTRARAVGPRGAARHDRRRLGGAAGA